SPAFVNLIGSLVYAATLPYIAIATTLLWFDLQARGCERAEAASRPGLRERAAAVVALACALGAAVFAVVALLGDVAGVVQVLVCVLLLALGAWLVLTRRGSARAAGIAT